MQLRAACPEDAPTLTEIAHVSKAHWGYPAKWLELWRDDLTFTTDDIARDHVVVAEIEGRVEGFGTLAGDGKDRELDALFVHPRAIGRGVGKALATRLFNDARKDGVTVLKVASDPNAVDFYVKLGAVAVGEVASVPEGRRLPVLRIEL